MAVDFGMDLDAIYTTPRLDVSGLDAVLADARLGDDVVQALEAKFPTQRTFQSLGVRPFASPQAAMRRGGENRAGAVAEMATSKAVAQ